MEEAKSTICNLLSISAKCGWQFHMNRCYGKGKGKELVFINSVDVMKGLKHSNVKEENVSFVFLN